MGADDGGPRAELLQDDRSRTETIQEKEIDEVGNRRQPKQDAQQHEADARPSAVVRNRRHRPEYEPRQDEDHRQDEREQQRPEADDHPHRRNPGTPCPPESEGPFCVVFRGGAHGRAFANRREDEERNRQHHPQHDQEDDQADVLANPGRDLLLYLRGARGASSAAGALVEAGVESGPAFAREQRDQP